MYCQHPACDCINPVVELQGRRYCCESCSTATSPHSDCECAHAGCGRTLPISDRHHGAAETAALSLAGVPLDTSSRPGGIGVLFRTKVSP